jgi:hypothetical protein
LTPGDIDDRAPVPQQVKHLFGKLFGDKGYVSRTLADQLRESFGIELLTKIRSNMRNQFKRKNVDGIKYSFEEF